MNVPFVSLAFFATHIQVAQLDEEQKNIRFASAIPLPPHCIEGYKVNDSTLLGTILTRIWKELSIKERTVGIAIPEFSSFSKTVTLPILPEHELNEAVHWQVKDYLPDGGVHTVMDWKIIKTDESNFNILTVAIDNTVLSGYIDASEKAGLLPIVVETPSLSMERLVRNPSEVFGKIILYAQYGEVIIACVKGQEIIGSAVVDSKLPELIASTVRQMIRHYAPIEVKKVYLGGTELTTNHLSYLQKLGIPLEWLDAKVGGVTVQNQQQYLIPLSLQRKDTLEPEDTRTVNLLPPEWVHRYDQKKTERFLRIGLSISAAFVGLSVVLFLIVWMMLLREHQNLSNFDTKQTSPLTQEKQILQINSISSLIQKVTKSSYDPNVIIGVIHKASENGIVISEYQINLDVGTITFRGIASDRSTLLAFRTSIENEKNFSSVQIPLSSLVGTKDVPFSATLQYLPISQKVKKKTVIKQTINP
jgi:hypothetical protein